MADKKKDLIDENEGYYVTLTDEETGRDIEFEVYARCTLDGNDYYALVALDGNPDEYILFRGSEVDGATYFESIEDDDEFERVEDYMGDLLFGEVDYDEN